MSDRPVTPSPQGEVASGQLVPPRVVGARSGSIVATRSGATPVAGAWRRWLQVSVALGAVGLGLLLARLWPDVASSDVAPVSDLWLARPLDLALHLALMLAGALGLRALLPGEQED